MPFRNLLAACACAFVAGCSHSTASSAASASPQEARKFLETVSDTTLRLGIQQSQASWVQQTYITDDSEAIAARANQAANEAGARFAREATRYDHVDVPAGERRQLNLLKVSLVLATPSDRKESDQLSKIMARLESTFGKGKWCPDPSKPDSCRNIDDITRL